MPVRSHCIKDPARRAISADRDVEAILSKESHSVRHHPVEGFSQGRVGRHTFAERISSQGRCCGPAIEEAQ